MPLNTMARACSLVLLAALPLPLAAQAASPSDDRPAITTFVATGVISSRRLQDDLLRAPWSPQELRDAVARSYGITTLQLNQYLGTAAGTALLAQQVPLFSNALAPQLRLAALRAALVADSRDGAISLLGVLQQLPLRFVLADGPLPPANGPAVCGCADGCGGSSLARLAFLMACLQGGITAVGR